MPRQTHQPCIHGSLALYSVLRGAEHDRLEAKHARKHTPPHIPAKRAVCAQDARPPMVMNSPPPRTTYVVIMVYGRVEGREVHEDAWIYLDRPIRLYDDSVDSPWSQAVELAKNLTAEKLKLHTTIGLKTYPKDWSEDVDVMNEGLIPIPDGL